MSEGGWVARVFPRDDDPAGARGLVAIFLVTAIALLARDARVPAPVVGLLVEVTGEVARPGWHLVDPPTLGAAVEAAGGPVAGVPETPLTAGDAVWVAPEGARVVRASQPLLAGVALEVGVDAPAAFAALPGMGEARAAELAPERVGPAPVDRGQIGGVARRSLEEAGAAVRAPPPEARAPLDVNAADAAALERLPGIGPALAARIVADREARGPFRRVEDLDRVSGIGAATLARFADQVVAGR
jgi:competence protein ComEA